MLDRLRELPDDSVDSIVTDPPYGIRFMGKAWDGDDIIAKTQDRAKYSTDPNKRAGIRGGHRSRAAEAGKYDLSPSANFQFQQWTEAWAAQAIRVLKPGGHLMVFAATRTYHRMTCGVEDAGFEIRDQIGWVFGSGFPKSHNLHGDWEGWGTALKPAWEPICVARKPFKGTVAENVARWGTGAINIAGCRIETSDELTGSGSPPLKYGGDNLRPFHATAENRGCNQDPLGRWPANIVHDGSDEVLAAFPDAPGQCADVKFDAAERKTQSVYGAMKRGHEPSAESTYAENGGTNFAMKPGARRLDEGSAARFFYCAKASREDRNEGCEGFDSKPLNWSSGAQSPGTFQAEGTDRTSRNNHPTVKPTDLMRYLCRLVTPPNGTVLDCFMGSGSTGKAALLEGFGFIGIEGEPAYCEIATARLEHVIATDCPLLRAIESIACQE